MARLRHEQLLILDRPVASSWCREDGATVLAIIHPMASSTHLPALPRSFFARPAELVAPELVGCLLARRTACDGLLWGMVVGTEAYSQDDPACHGHRRRSPSNDTRFGEPGRFYVYLTYGMHHCVNVVTDRLDWANGVLHRAVALLARWFGIDRRHDNLLAAPAPPRCSGGWQGRRPPEVSRSGRRSRSAAPGARSFPGIGICATAAVSAAALQGIPPPGATASPPLGFPKGR
jgi:3-methyladenine DNA glycosylase Mpg